MGGLVNLITGQAPQAQVANVDPNLAAVNPAFTGNSAYQGANAGVNQGLGGQAALAQALTNQNGVGNQSQALAQQQALAGQYGQLAGQNAQGIGNQQSVYNQYGQIASGQGPNPALAALAQATGTNTANQAALMAGQRGAGANTGLIARQAAQQGAANQQSAAGQAATLQAQQSLAALGQQSGIAGQQVGQQYGALAGQQGALNQFGGLAGQQVGQLQQQQQGLLGNQLTNQSQQLDAIAHQNANNVSLQNAVQTGQNTQNNTAQQGSQDFYKGLVGGGLNSAGGGVAKFAKGGEVKNQKLGEVPISDRFPAHQLMPGHLKEIANIYHGQSFGNPNYQMQEKGYAEGGKVEKKPAQSSISELASMKTPEYSGEYREKKLDQLYNDNEPKMMSSGGNVGSKLKGGGKVPGQAKMSGDHLANDTVKAALSPGEVVIPKSVMESDDPAGNAAKFVAAIAAKKGGPKHESDFRDALKREIKGRKKS